MFTLQKRILFVILFLFSTGIFLYILNKERVPQNPESISEELPITQSTTDLGDLYKDWVTYQNRQLGFQTLIPDKSPLTEELDENFIYFPFDDKEIPSLGNFRSSVTIGIAQGNFINRGTRYNPNETATSKYLGEINGLKAYEIIHETDTGEIEGMLTMFTGPTFDYYIDMSGGEFPKTYTPEEQTAYRIVVKNFRLIP